MTPPTARFARLLEARSVVFLLLAALALTVFWLRTAPGWEFYAPTHATVVLPETDPYYHFRQAAYTLENYPRLLREDAGSHYPAVERNDAVGLYTLLLATLAKALAGITGLPPLRALYWVCALLPPLFAGGITLAVFGLVRRQASAAVALVMALWTVLLPGDGLARTSLAFCDHHMVEMLLSLLCIRGAVKLATTAASRPRPWWRPAWGAALPLAAFLFTWLGAPLYLPIFALAFAGQLVADVLAGREARAIARAAVRYWSAFFVLATAIGLLAPDLVMHIELWRFSCAGGALAAVFFAVAGWYFDSSRIFPRRPETKVVLAAVVCVLVFGGMALVSPALRELVRDMVAHKSLQVLENVPVTPRYYFALTGLAGVLALLAPAIGILTGAARRPGWWLALLPSLLLIALWCRTFDYAYLGALHAVVLAGYAWGARSERREAWLGPGMLTAATAVIVVGVVAGWTQPVRLPRVWYEGPIHLATPAWQQATAWLARQPAASPGRPAGVLTDWPHGNLVNTLGHQPAISSRYPEAEGLRPLYLESEDAVRTAPLRGSTVAAAVRYVALDPSCLAEYLPTYLAGIGLDPQAFVDRESVRSPLGLAHSRPTMSPRYERLFAHRLLLQNGAGLSHFRLVFASEEPVLFRLVHNAAQASFGPETTLLSTPALREQAEAALRRGTWQEGDREVYGGRILPGVSVFEQVAGAHLTGLASPYREVTATLDLETGSGATRRRFTHRVLTRAGSDGRFELIVPYATEASSDTTVRPLGRWNIESAHQKYNPCPVPESAVIHGERLDVTPLRSDF